MSGTTNITLPAIPAPSAGALPAIFVKGTRNNGAVTTAPQYVTFAHSFQKGELPAGQGLEANFGAGEVPCQVDVKTSYADGSAAHAIVSVAAPTVAAGATVWGQFSVTTPPAGAALSIAAGLGTTALSLEVTPNPPSAWAPTTAVVVGNVNAPAISSMVKPAASGNPGGFIFQVRWTGTPGDWGAGEAVVVGALVLPSAGNAGKYVFQCTTAGTTAATEPAAWPQTVGETITDGVVTWVNIGVVGQTGLTEPAWPQTPGAQVSDGTVEWCNAGTGVPASTTDLVTLVKSAAADLWLSGPLAVQGRASVALGGFMRVVVDATAYADGTVNFDVTLANDITTTVRGQQTLPCGGVACYTATLTLNGKQAFQSAPLTHYFHENWSWQVGTVPHLTNSSQENVLEIIHDPRDFINAQATQSYDTSLGVASATLSGSQSAPSATGFGQPLTNTGLVSRYMPGVGGRPDIGIDDIFVCWWFVTQDPTFRQIAFECAKISGGIPWHFHNADTGETWTFDECPDLWTLAWPGLNIYGTSVSTFFTGEPNWSLDPAHFPELIYIQYLTTGRRYFLDELNYTTFWAIATTSNGPGARNNAQGIFLRADQVRGCAWCLRNTNYAVYANPDGTKLKTFFRRMLDNNLQWFLGQIASYQAIQGPELFGYFPPYSYGNSMPNFEECYLLSSMTFSALLGHPAAQQICEWMGHYFTGLLLNGSNDPITGLPPAQACTYDLTLYPTSGTYPGGGYWGCTIPPAQTWDAYEALEASEADSCVQNGQIVWVYNIPSGGTHGDYSQLIVIGLTCLANIGVANAAEALNVMLTQKASDGTTPPTLDPASLAAANQTWHVLPHTLNASQVIAAPSDPVGYGSVYMPSLVTKAGAVTGAPAAQPISASGGGVMPAVDARGAASVPGYAALANALSAVHAALASL